MKLKLEESPPASLLMLCRLAGFVVYASAGLLIIFVFLMHK